LVRAAVVVRAIQAGGRPTGSPVAATGGRPAGLVLRGISRYGSALRDGDVLTSISGAKATSSSVVVGAVIGAIKARSRAITGVIWRGQERLTVTVELPLS
jgi:S1-C subfamily serine protease